MKNESNGYFKTWAKVMFDPLVFFDQLKIGKRYRKPTLFAIKTQALLLAAMYVILLCLGLLFLLIASVSTGGLVATLGGITIGAIVAISILAFPLLLLWSWGMLYVSAGVMHLFVLVFGGKKGYLETFNIYCYSIAPILVIFIPIVNYAAVIYSSVLQGMGVHKRHQLSVAKSVGVVLLPIVVIGGLYLIVLFFFFMAGVINSPGIII